MATSGTTTFDLDANEIMEEAFERAGVDKQKLNADHARSARRSMNLILQDWANENIRPWAMEEATITTVAGVAETLLSADTIDVIDVTLKRDNYEIPMTRLSRSDYQALRRSPSRGAPIDTSCTRTGCSRSCSSIRRRKLDRHRGVLAHPAAA